MEHRAIFGLLLLLVLFKSAVPDCTVTRTSEQRMVQQRNYGYSYRTEITYKYYIKCTDVTLHTGVPLSTYMQNYVNEATKALSIEFTSSTLDAVPVGVFHAFSTVEILSMNNAAIKSISPGAFGGMTQLGELFLNNNHISEVQTGTFDGLLQLKKLEMSGNQLTKLKSLNRLTKLEVLMVNSNNITTIDVGAFKDTVKLIKLDLSDNQLVNLSATLFSTMPELRKVHLQNNYIEYIPTGLFNKTQSLTDVKLQNNTIRSVPCNELMGSVDLRLNRITALVNCSKNIVHFDVSYNHLTSLPAMFFNKAASLTVLDLNHNNISSIDEDAFVELRILTQLRMNNNRITTIPIGIFRNLTRLTTLNLSRNNVMDLKFGVFTGLTRLQVLDVSDNKIAWLESKVLFPLKSLTQLKLDGNLLRTFDTDTMASHLTTLKSISLDRNQMQCEWLTSCIYVFTLRNVTVLSGDSFKTSNVHGVYCLGEKDYGNATMPSDNVTELSTTKQQTTMKLAVSTAAVVPTATIPSDNVTELLSSTTTKQPTTMKLAVSTAAVVPSAAVMINTTAVPSVKVLPIQATPSSTTRKPSTTSFSSNTVDEWPDVSRINTGDKISETIRAENEKTNALLASIGELLKAHSHTPALLSLAIVAVFILIVILVVISLFNMYSIKRILIKEKRRKSLSSCGVELLHVTD